MSELEAASIVVLTKDEAHNLPDCLEAVLPQLDGNDEVIIIDSASKDATVEIAQEYARKYPERVRVHAYEKNVSFGEARNKGLSLANTDVCVMLSADATPEAGWLAALRAALGHADIVYGRQRHAPPRQNAATVSRGLRYHHFEGTPAPLAETYASNVNAAYRIPVFSQLRFDETADGAEDVAFARQARLAGLRLAYAPSAIVNHKDVASWRGEWRKHTREGRARAQLAALLGAPNAHLIWVGLVAFLSGISLIFSSLPLALAALAAFALPTFRRLASPVARRYSPASLILGVLVSPIFDLAFISAYVSKRLTS